MNVLLFKLIFRIVILFILKNQCKYLLMYVLKKLSSYISFKKVETDNYSLRPHPNSLTTIYIKRNTKYI